MTRHVALLRAVNVGGRGKIAMADLKKVAAAVDFTDVATVLQSGSLVFSATGQTVALERRLATGLADHLALATEVIVRSRAQWGDLIGGNPFLDMAKTDPSHVLALVCKQAPTPGAEALLRQAIKGPEDIAVRGTVAYALFPDGIGRSKLTGALIERLLCTPTTGRNWTTVLKIAGLLGL